jgi:type III restriction enzyme
MSQPFFDSPILNSPYQRPSRHWETQAGQPTQRILEVRRKAEFIMPIPKPRKQKRAEDEAVQTGFLFDEGKGLSTEEQAYDPTAMINEVRAHVDAWRAIPDPNQWQVTPETARLLTFWRTHEFQGVRPFFCQVEAVETAIWLMEVAPKRGKEGQRFLKHLETCSEAATPGIMRLALKLATGAGKTTVMAMLIAWQTINAVRHRRSEKFTSGFLVVTPGITIRDRLRVLQPNDPDSYYRTRELVPQDMRGDLAKAKIVITNYHAFKLRERGNLSKGNRALLQGRTGDAPHTLETEGQMIQRVMPALMGLKNILVLNDEAHHCYREKPNPQEDDAKLDAEAKKEAEENNEAARLWLSGLEIVRRHLPVELNNDGTPKKKRVLQVIDLSATPFFLQGSGYPEGTIFPWVVSDFSLMDAIECGIVKLPRVPVADNIPGAEVPVFRNLWENIRKEMPKQGRGANKGKLDPLALPARLQTALEALYGHYKKQFEFWQAEGMKVPPCFIIVCNNTSTSKLVYDYVSGFHREHDDGTTTLENGRLALFRNFDENGVPYARPRTLLIDSAQLESGEGLDKGFEEAAKEQIEVFKREVIERSGQESGADQPFTPQELLREVMNTVGKVGRLGESIRCVVSVSMLTEGWDANTVTHILGVRAFGTQLLCEQVIGRALRRSSYDLGEDGLFRVEYADVLGIPFDFNDKPVVSGPQKPREAVHVRALPEREALQITFPRVLGYRVELPEERLVATFNADSVLHLTPELVGPSITKNAGIIGQDADLGLEHLRDERFSSLIYHVTKRLLYTKWRDPNEDPKLHLFGQLKRVVRQWFDEGCLVCVGGTYPAQLRYQELTDMACERITAGITRAMSDARPIKALLDPYNPVGSTAHVNFHTSKLSRWTTDPRRAHVNFHILDSDWEGEFCRVAESHPRVRAYVKNHSLGFEVPYRMGSQARMYRPDFLLLVEDGHGEDDLLRLVVEIKGYRGEDAKDKRATMETYWVPGVNHLRDYGRWGFAEFTNVHAILADLGAAISQEFDAMLEGVARKA